jgi:hypothetical protein
MKQRSNRLLRLILQIEEDGGLTLAIGQLIDRTEDSPQLVASLDRVGRVRGTRRRGLRQSHLDRLSPKDSAGLTADDLPQPGAKRFGRAERPHIPEGHQKRVLHGILGTAAVAQ